MEDIPYSGRSNPNANPFAVVSPIRSPVKEPGPSAAPTAKISDFSISALFMRPVRAGSVTREVRMVPGKISCFIEFRDGENRDIPPP
jgi:hypothetical protein